MPIKKPFKEAPSPEGASRRTDRIYYNPYKEEMKPAMRWPSQTTAIDVYRTDPKTGKLESLAHKYDVGFGNQLDEASARLPIDPGMLHAIADANKITPALGVTPKEMVSLLAQEGRTDFGANDLNVDHFAHNKQAVDLYSKLKAMGYDEMQAGLPALMLEKKRVADKLDVPWQAAWQGMGTTETGRTHKDYLRELTLNTQNIKSNKPALDVFTQEMSEPSKPRDLEDVNMRAWVARQKMVQSERDKMKTKGASDEQVQRAFPDAPIPFPDDPNAGLYELTQKYAKGGIVKKDNEPTIGQTIENLSYGLGEGFGRQVQGLGTMVAHPIESGKAIVHGVRAMVEDPSLIKQAAVDLATRATSSPQGLGEVIGENVSPTGLIKSMTNLGKPKVLGIIKEKGGNWLKGNTPISYSPERYVEGIKDFGHADELNKWIDTKLVKYMKNDMGTADDPVRKLFDQGIKHAEVRNTFLPQTVMQTRMDAGQPVKGLAENPMGASWEDAVDMTILPKSAFHYLPSSRTSSRQTVVNNNPWLMKVPLETQVHSIADHIASAERLGFKHLTDELHNATREGSDLPEHLRLDPKKLDKVTVPQAVQLVDKINKWREANASEANLALANNPATVLHKEYPEEGFKWVQLRRPLDPKARLENPNALAEALKYEGNAMGHCVGGYCPAVDSGESQIFSLRDKKGQPHVTIEVQRDDLTPEEYYDSGEISDDLQRQLDDKYLVQRGPTWNDIIEESPEYQEFNANIPPKIVQIKGKSNEAPIDKYITFVQDFVRSRKWSGVDDLENARLTSLGYDDYDDLGMAKMQLQQRMEEAGHVPDQEYFTEQELRDLMTKFGVEQKFAKGGAVKRLAAVAASCGCKKAEGAPVNFPNSDTPDQKYTDTMGQEYADANVVGYAEGGLVVPTAQIRYDPARVSSIVERLRQDMFQG